MGYLILRGASRLDAFSVYPFRTWLPCPAPGSATGPPAVRPSRSSRTKDSSFQNYIHVDIFESCDQAFWSSPRPISSSQLHTLPYFHLCPIYLVVFKGSYFFRMGYLILRGASRLDAFSVYPFRAWLPGYRLGSLTGAPAARPSRSSRTKDSSSQISYAHAG